MKFSKPVQDIIRSRYSCRNYDPDPIQPELRNSLSDFLSNLQRGPFGGQPRFKLVAATESDRKSLRSLGTYGFIKGASGFIVGAMEQGGSNLEDFGYQMERAILYATDLGLGTCWLGGTFTKSGFGRKLSTSENELIPAVTSIGHINDEPRRIEKFIRRGANAERRLPWGSLFFDQSIHAPLALEDAGDYAGPLEMVRLGPSASNKQPWRVIKDGKSWHFYLQRTPGYREGLLVRLVTVADLQRIDMGIAMCHFELTAREAGLDGRWLQAESKGASGNGRLEYTASWVSRS